MKLIPWLCLVLVHCCLLSSPAPRKSSKKIVSKDNASNHSCVKRWFFFFDPSNHNRVAFKFDIHAPPLKGGTSKYLAAGVDTWHRTNKWTDPSNSKPNNPDKENQILLIPSQIPDKPRPIRKMVYAIHRE